MKKSSKRSKSKKSSRKSSKKSSKKGGSKTNNEKIIFEYLEKLLKQLEEKNWSSFCVFPDEGFKNKMHGMDDIKKIIKKNPTKHKYLACIKIYPTHNQPTSIQRKNGIWLQSSISVTPINEKGELVNKDAFGVSMHWKENDFKITKLSMKFLEKLMEKIIKKEVNIGDVYGFPLRDIIEDLKRLKKIDLSKYFTPLDNLN